MKKKIHILLVDDSATQRTYVQSMLDKETYIVETAIDGIDAMNYLKVNSEKTDIILSDIFMPNMDGFELCTKVKQLYINIPLIILTSHNDETNLKKAFESGAIDYLAKPFSETELVMRILNVLLIFDTKKKLSYKVSELHTKEVELKNQNKELSDTQLTAKKIESRFKHIFENASDAFLIISGSNFIDCNESAVQLLNAKSKKQVLISHPSQLSPEKQPDGRNSLEKANEMMDIAHRKGFHRFEWIHKKLTGEVFPVEVSLTAIEFNSKLVLYTLWKDLTKVKEKEELLIRFHKMEAVGQLVGGIAHDYNNIMTVIMGNAENALIRIIKNENSDRKLINNLKEIKESSLSASGLSKRLLTLGRKDFAVPEAINLKDILDDNASILQHVLSANISLEFLIEEDIYDIKVDVFQVEQMMLNLVINAVESISDSGTITIKVSNTVVDKTFAANHNLNDSVGYVILTISDTGCGIENEILKHIFDPFFTTKPVGKGIGLGLSTVYRIINEFKGCITVESEIDKGTEFKIYFPVNVELDKSKKEEIVDEETDVCLDGVTILFADDDSQILNLSKEYLEILGYKVLSAQNGYDAMKLASEHKNEIKLLITDVIMPEMNGAELYQAISEFIPYLNVIFTSGYTDDILEKYLMHENQYLFIQKPYSPQNLASYVSSSLRKLKVHNHRKEHLSSDNESFVEEVLTSDERKQLTKYKDILVTVVNNAMYSLSERTVFPLCEKLRYIDGLQTFSNTLMLNMQQFNLKRVESSLIAISKVLER